MPNNLTDYDAFQVLRSVFDVNKNTLRVSIIDGSTGGGAFEVLISHTDDSIRLGDGTKLTTATQIGPKVGLDVNLINEIDIRDLSAAQDNVAIRDADGNELAINPDGSINISPGVSEDVTSREAYNEVSAVAAAVETIVATLMAAGVGTDTYLQKVQVSGENIAEFRVKVNGTIVDKRRTFFGNLNETFDFQGQTNPGRFINQGDTVEVTVIHNRPFVADFNAKIQVLEVT